VWNIRPEKCLEHKEIALGAFLDIEGAFDNTSFKTIITTARERGLEETYCRWIGSMLGCRLVHISLMGSNLTAKLAGGCPQGGVLSPLLWNLVVDRLLTVAKT
jgi:retron-type reverse transcriptase